MAEHEFCFYGADALANHLWKLLALPRFTVRICFGKPHVPMRAADRTRAEIARMRTENVPELVASES